MLTHVTQPLKKRTVRLLRPRNVFCLRIWVACYCLLCTGRIAVQAQEVVAREYQIKAAYLYNFAKFVEWPKESFTNNEAPLVIGVFGQNPFGEELNAIARDHQINGRSIVIKPVATIADAAGVHLMFIGSAEDKQVAQTLEALKNKDILTVGESDKFMAADGIIDFVRQADKVRFEINASAAERHRLKISAQLLKLAAAVRRENHTQP